MAVIFSIPILLVFTRITVHSGEQSNSAKWNRRFIAGVVGCLGTQLWGPQRIYFGGHRRRACFVYNRNTLVYLFIGVPFSNFTRALLFSKTLGITFVGDVDNHYDRKHIFTHSHLLVCVLVSTTH